MAPPHHHGHGGHRGGRGGIGWVRPSTFIYELDCDPNDPFYRECIARFGNDSNFGGILDNAYSDNIEAIRSYMSATPVNTPEAQSIKDTFVQWYDGLSWYGKGLESNFDLARNQRNRFNLANAATPEDKEAVQTVISTGLSSEQVRGQPDRRNAEGMLPGPVAPPPPPLIPEKYVLAGAAVLSVAAIAWAYGYGKK